MGLHLGIALVSLDGRRAAEDHGPIATGQYGGSDVWQLKVILHALGYFEAGQPELATGDDAQLYTKKAVAAVDAFRTDQGLRTARSGGSPRGLVDAQTIALLWQELEARGIADQVRTTLLETIAVRR